MNKAFCRETDELTGRCPRCGANGVVVRGETLQLRLSADQLQKLTESAFFCPRENCEVVYFDDFERAITTADIAEPIYPKDPAAPICPCFGLSRDDVEQDIAEGGVTRVRALLEKAKSPAARCQMLSPSGQSCVSEVQRYYMKLRGGGGT